MFLRMANIYAKHWLDMWAHLDIETVKAEWEKTLSSSFTWKQVLAGIEYCAEHVKFPPTLPEFRDICKQLKNANAPITQALPRKFSQEELDANHEKIQKATSQVTKGRDYKKWAKDAIAKHEAGERVPDKTLKDAREALGIKVEDAHI